MSSYSLKASFKKRKQTPEFSILKKAKIFKTLLLLTDIINARLLLVN